MEIVQNIHLDKVKNESQQHPLKSEFPKKSMNETNFDDDIKYLHKKFKRVVNTINDINSRNAETKKIIDFKIPPNNEITKSILSKANIQTSNTQNKESNIEKPPLLSEEEIRLKQSISITVNINETPHKISSANYIQGNEIEFHNKNQKISNNSTLISLNKEIFKTVPNGGYVTNINNNINENKIEFSNSDKIESKIYVKPTGQFMNHNLQKPHNNLVYVSQDDISTTLPVSQLNQATPQHIKSEQLQYNIYNSNTKFTTSTYVPSIQNNLDKVSLLSSSSPSSDIHFAATASPLTVAVASPSNTSTSTLPSSGRHVCPFCNLNCTKPSVLQKHIRSHTNERPYPCGPCGCAFKTKSNLYKHQR